MVDDIKEEIVYVRSKNDTSGFGLVGEEKISYAGCRNNSFLFFQCVSLKPQ